MGTEDRKRAAVNFLRFAREGNRAGAEHLVLSSARHHNPYFQAGMPALLDAISAAADATSHRDSDVKRVLADGDYVEVHSHVRHSSGVRRSAVVDIFRFDGNRVAELRTSGSPFQQTPRTQMPCSSPGLQARPTFTKLA